MYVLTQHADEEGPPFRAVCESEQEEPNRQLDEAVREDDQDLKELMSLLFRIMLGSHTE